MKRTITTPKGFRLVRVENRVCFQAVDPSIRIDHEVFMHQLLERAGYEGTCSMPDQIECVCPHLHNSFLLKMDLSKAFASIPVFGLSVVLYLDDMFEKNWRWYLHPHGGLIEGAPASPLLFHLFMQEWIEPELDALCEKLNLVWTRYVDDFLFSSPQFISTTKRRTLQKYFKQKGFRVNSQKTRAVDLFTEDLTHLGIVIRRGGKVDITEDAKAKLRASPVGSEQKRQLLAWRKRVLAITMR